MTVYPEDKQDFTIYWLVPEGKREDQTNFHTQSFEKRAAAYARLVEQTLNEYDIPRDDPALVQVVEEMGAVANGRYADLAVVEIPDNVAWQIEESDGLEHIAEKHRTWWPVCRPRHPTACRSCCSANGDR